MSSFLFPNTITISRPKIMSGVGAQEYSGLLSTEETVVKSCLAAHVQADRQGTAPTAQLPGDAAGQSIWKIIFRGSKGLVTERDIITDEQNKRYQVISAYWGPLTTTCRCQLMGT
jgi:hypothetical protein